jgi:type I restriction enzyme S subunit
LDIRYYQYVLLAMEDQLTARSLGTTFLELSSSALAGLPVPSPPVSAQGSIADYLDAETGRIDALIAEKQRMIGLLEEKRSVQMTTLVFGRDTAQTMRLDPLLGPLPVSWERVRLRYCVRITVGVVVNPSSYFVEDGVPFIHGSDVRDGWIDTSNMKYLSAESNDLLVKSRLRAGDVVVVRAGYPGRAAVVPPELDGSNCASILILRQGKRVSSEYLCHFLNCREARVQVALAQYGAAQEQINVSDIVDFVAPLPPRLEQDRIVAAINTVASTLDRATGALRRQIDLLLEHRQALIAAAVSGETAFPGAAA